MLRVILAAKNISQEDVRRALVAKGEEITPAQVSRIVGGTRKATPRQEEIIADFLSVPRDLICAGGGDSIVDTLVESSKAPHVEESRVDIYLLAREAGLEIFDDISESEGRERIAIYPQRLAATPHAQIDAADEDGEIWLPLRRGKIHGATARAIRVSGHSMNQAGIDSGDILIIRQSSTPADGKIIIASESGDVTIKRRRGRQLIAESDRKFSPITLSEDAHDADGNKQLGVVIGIHKPLKP